MQLLDVDRSCSHTREQVLDGSPWVQSKPVYVLAASTREAPDGMTFTLRTRVARPRLENELTKVCAVPRESVTVHHGLQRSS